MRTALAAAVRAVRGTWALVAFSLWLAFEASPRLAGALVGLIAVDAVAPLANLAVMALLVRSAVRGEPIAHWLPYLAALAGLALVQRLLQNARQTIQEAAQDRITTFMQGRLIRAANAVPGLELFEDPDYHDRLARSHMVAQQGPLALVAQGTLVVQTALTVASLLIAVGTLSPWLAALLLAAHLPQMAMEYGYAATIRTGLVARGEDGRRIQDATGAFWDPATARDSHLLRLGGFFLDQHRRAYLAITAELGARRRAAVLRMIATALVGAAATGMVAVVVAADAVRGAADVGTLALVLGAAIGLEGAFAAAGYNVGAFGFMMAWLPDLRALMALPADEPGAGPPPAPVRDGIRFESVSFTYPGAASPALRDVSFVVRPGELIGLVGPNGAGKSTIAKLLLGLYRPTTGRITVDGADLGELDLPAWRAAADGVFQDFMRYSFTCRENIGVGSLPDLEDRERVLEAAGAGGARDLIDELPDGLDTELTSRFGGVELSGGQWQRVALGRGAMRREPEIIVLDEPTAALDARQEYEVYRRWGRLHSRATVLVTHRVGTVRHADRILLIDEGRVVEHGSPAELLASGGRYAALDRLQREQYGLTNGEAP